MINTRDDTDLFPARKIKRYKKPVITGHLATPTTVIYNLDMSKNIMTHLVRFDSFSLVISLNPFVNLIIHTMNLYDMLGNHGSRYHLRKDAEALESIDKDLYEKFAYKEQYFNYNGTFSIYEKIMKSVITNEQYLVYPDSQNLMKLASRELLKALTESWNKFYQEYWGKRYKTLENTFSKMIKNNPWKTYARKMTSITQEDFKEDIYIFATEATAESAITAGTQICIGTLDLDSDAGFVHEGLHLLLQEKWSKDKRIQDLMKKRQFNEIGGWGTYWQAKYEQALVVALDSYIKNLSKYGPDAIPNYFRGCNVGDLYEIVWPKIHQLIDKKLSTEDFMLEVIKKDLSRK